MPDKIGDKIRLQHVIDAIDEINITNWIKNVTGSITIS